MKEGGYVIVLRLTPLKLAFVFINLMCLMLLIMWVSEENNDPDFRSSSLFHSHSHSHSHAHLLFTRLRPPDISTGIPLAMANFTSELEGALAIDNTMPITASASIIDHSYGTKGKAWKNVEAPIGTIKGSHQIMTRKGCNYGMGKWVADERRPLYSGGHCRKWLSKTWACRSSQRVDFAYEKFRWQPKDCDLEEFQGSKFLQRMRNKTLAFIGDSLGQQQFQSLMCMTVGNEAIPHVIDVGKEYNLVKPHKKAHPNGWAYRFLTTNTTILFYWSPCLCDLVRFRRSKIAMHLDRPPAFLRKFLPRLNVLVLNTGHHWSPVKFHSNHWVIHVGGESTPSMDIGQARNFTIHSVVKWVDSRIQHHPSLIAFYRTISPRHFSNGEWYNGGACDNTVPFMTKKNEIQTYKSSDLVPATAVQGTRVKLLDVTALSELRDEGHVSKYGVRAKHGIQDCLHWCLPGIPDTWNEILFAQLQS